MGQLIRAATVNLSSPAPAGYAQLADAGFESVDLSIDSVEQFTGDAAEKILSRAADQAAAHGLGIACVTLRHLPVELACGDHSSRGQIMASLDRLVRTSGELGAGLCGVAPPAVVASNGASKTVGYRDALNGVYRVLGELSQAAEFSGVCLGVCAPCHGCLLSAVEVCELIEAVASSCVGVSVQVEQLNHIGRVEDWLAVLGRHVVSMRLTLNTLAGIESLLQRSGPADCVVVIDNSVQG
ncbi:MAG: hypothetical protein V3W34_19870 [Phycisphaerae bacterium]